MKYSIMNDTVVIDIYGETEPKAIGITSKWKLVMKDGQLLFTYIAHLYGDEMQEVKEPIYLTVSEFDQVK
jgi:hypothetical protein